MLQRIQTLFKWLKSKNIEHFDLSTKIRRSFCHSTMGEVKT
jgi:hypothetical protein